MSSSSQPRPYAVQAAGTIRKGRGVKLNSSGKALECTAKTDKSVAIALGDAVEGEFVELAYPGGGAKGKMGGSVSAGDLLAPTTDGRLIATTTANDRYCAVAMEDAVENDLAPVEVVLGNV